MGWTLFKTIGHSLKNLALYQKTLRPLGIQVGYGLGFQYVGYLYYSENLNRAACCPRVGHKLL